MLSHLAPFFARFPFEDLSHLFFELIKIGILGKVLLLDAKLVQEGGVELRLDAPDGHEVVVQGAVSLVEVDARVEKVLTSWIAPLCLAVLGEEPGADIGGALHHVAVDDLQEVDRRQRRAPDPCLSWSSPAGQP